jgi:hypothetical protein
MMILIGRNYSIIVWKSTPDLRAWTACMSGLLNYWKQWGKIISRGFINTSFAAHEIVEWTLNNMTEKRLPIIVSILLASLSTLAFEITLVRIFSVSLWYHFAYMVISIAMLGIGASGTVLSMNSTLKNKKYLPVYCLVLGLSIPCAYILTNMIPFDPARLAWDRIQILYIGAYYLFLSIPFFFFGLIIATALATMRDYTGFIYGADLVGASVGSLSAILFLSLGGPDKVVLIVSLIALSSSLLYRNKMIQFSALIIIVIGTAVLLFSPSWMNPRVSPYKPLPSALRYPGAQHLKTYYSPFSRIDVFRSSAVRFAPGLSFQYREDLPEQTGLVVDAGEMNAITHPANREEMSFLSYLPSALPFELSEREDVLVLDPRGGLEVLMADYYGSRNIYKVDSNPLVIKAVRDFTGERGEDIYEKLTWRGVGRSWLISYDKMFDVITVSLMGSMPQGSFGFSEDYRFTVDAFEEYLRHLKPEGFLSVSLFIIPPPRTELRLVSTIAEAFRGEGVEDAGNHIMAVRSWGAITVVAKKSKITTGDIQSLKDFADTRRFDLIYYPGIQQWEANRHIEMPTNEYFDFFQALLDSRTRSQFIDDYLFDIEPVHDENPFFHYYLKFQNVRDIFAVMGEKWQYFLEEGYLLPIILVQVLILSLILIFLPTVKRRARDIISPRKFPVLIYFALLGVGFMFIEISLIQKMILPLENPSYAVATVIFSILLSSGVGSLMSQRVQLVRKPWILIVLFCIVFTYSLSVPFIINGIIPFSFATKVILIFITLLPMGVLMGVPFPLGLSILGEKSQNLIPWAWAVNGCLSVLAPIVAIVFAMSVGFQLVIMTGAVLYLFAFFALKKILVMT